METNVRKVIGWLLLIAWVFGLAWLSPTPPTVIEGLRISYQHKPGVELDDATKKSDPAITKSDIERFINFNSKKIWFEWTLKLLLVLAGIAGAVMTLVGRRYWALVVLCTSLLFVVLWVIRQATFADPFIEAYLTYANAVLNGDDWGLIARFGFGSLFLPLLHLVVITYLFYYRPDTNKLIDAESAGRGAKVE